MVAESDDERRKWYGDAQRVVAEDAPYIRLWYKTNIAVSGTSIEGVTLTPSAEFTFLRNVVKRLIIVFAAKAAGSTDQIFNFSISCFASSANGVSACCSTIWVSVLRASSVLPAAL